MTCDGLTDLSNADQIWNSTWLTLPFGQRVKHGILIYSPRLISESKMSLCFGSLIVHLLKDVYPLKAVQLMKWGP